jgi:predicted ATP-grasp superfamily ATP-dependent carboligase
VNFQEIRDELLSSTQILLDVALGKLGFDRHVLGKITVDLGNGLYTVNINGETYNIYKKLNDSYSYLVNDTVRILIPNNNFSEKVINYKIR